MSTAGGETASAPGGAPPGGVAVNPRRIFAVTGLLVLGYLYLPGRVLVEDALTLPPYDLFVAHPVFDRACIVAAILICAGIALGLGGKPIRLSCNFEHLERLNKLGFLANVAVTIPLLLHFARNGVPADRSSAFSVFESYRSNIISVAFSNLYLATSIVAALSGRRAHALAWFALVGLPEIVLGSRITVFRLVVVLLCVVPASAKAMVAVLVVAFLTVGSRTIFLGQELALTPAALLPVLGETVNTYLGANLVWQRIGNVPCSGVGGALRFLVPPPLRWFSSEFSDFTTCINESYFAGYDLLGLAGSPVSDLLLSPGAVALSWLLSVIGLRAGLRRPSLGTTGSVILIFVLSCLPYVLRWGLIGASSFALSTALWYLAPLIFLTKPRRPENAT